MPKHIRIERRFHREPGAEQRETAQPAPAGFFGACLDDADQRHRRARRDFIEDDMRRVRRYRDEIGATTYEATDRICEILDQRVPIVCHKVKGAVRIETVDDERRSVGWVMLLPLVEYAAVVVDRGLGPKTSDDPRSLHFVQMTMLPQPLRPTSHSVGTSASE